MFEWIAQGQKRQKGGIALNGREKEELIEKTLTEQYEKFYRLAYSYVKNEPAVLRVVGEAAYKAIYFSDKLQHPELAESWIETIVRREAGA